jgi:hypothetical protein
MPLVPSPEILFAMSIARVGLIGGLLRLVGLVSRTVVRKKAAKRQNQAHLTSNGVRTIQQRGGAGGKPAQAL